MPRVSLGGMSRDGGSRLPLCPTRSSPGRRLLQELLRKLASPAPRRPSDAGEQKSPQPKVQAGRSCVATGEPGRPDRREDQESARVPLPRQRSDDQRHPDLSVHSNARQAITACDRFQADGGPPADPRPRRVAPPTRRPESPRYQALGRDSAEMSSWSADGEPPRESHIVCSPPRRRAGNAGWHGPLHRT